MADKEILPDLEDEEISAIDIVKGKIDKNQAIFIYHCFKTIYPNEVKSHSEQYVAKYKKYDYTKKDAVILLAEALINKHGETKIIKIMDKHFPNIKKINIFKDEEEKEKENIINKTIDEGIIKQLNEIMQIKLPAVTQEIKINRITEVLNEFIRTK